MFHGDTFQPLEVNLALGEHSVQAVFPDAAGRHLYLGTYTQPSRVVRLAAPEMRRSASLTLPKGDDMIYCGARWGGAGVFGTSTLPGRLVKVDLETLAHLGTLEFNKCAPGPRRTRSAAALGSRRPRCSCGIRRSCRGSWPAGRSRDWGSGAPQSRTRLLVLCMRLRRL